jgi:four helix bundle protein
MQNPRNLRVWNGALDLATQTYRATTGFPKTEQFGLTSQMRRAAVSVGSNIAEGCGRKGDREYLAFLHIAMGSLTELEFQLELAMRLDFTSKETLHSLGALLEDVRRMLTRLIVAVRARLSREK